MAWKNISRNKRRTILTGSVLFLVTFVIIFYMSTEYGSMDDIKFNMVHNELGVIRARNPDYTKNERINPLGLYIEDTDGVTSELLKVENITRVEPRISTAVAFYKDEDTSVIPILGVNLDSYNVLTDKDNTIFEGSIEQTLADKKNVIISQRFAKNYNLHAGDKFTFMARTAGGGSNGYTVRVGAIEHFSDGDYSGEFIFMDFKTLSNVLRMNGNATELLVFTSDWTNNKLTESTIEKIRGHDALKDLELVGWHNGTALASMLQFTDIIYAVFSLIFFIFASTIIFNSTMMAVMERKKEIGSLLSLGMTPRAVQGLFLLETVITSFVAVAAGTILAAIGVNILGKVGINMAGSGYDTMSGWNIKLMLYPHLSFGRYFEFAFMAFAVAVIACVIPSRMALHVEPAEALRASE